MPEPFPLNEPTLSDDRDLLQQVLVLEEQLDGSELETLQSAIDAVNDDHVLSKEVRRDILLLWKKHRPPDRKRSRGP